MATDRWLLAADLLDPPELRYRTDPVRWAAERLGVKLWSKQREILEGLVEGDVAVHSCHGVGKSFSAATATCWWLDTHPPGTAFVITTAPTGAQVKAILWREINKLRKLGELPGRTNLTEWYIGDELVAMGRKPNDYEPDAFQGIHAPYVLVVYDEACGIPPSLWDVGSTLAINEQSRQLAIGNPDDPHGHFSQVCAAGSAWHVIKIRAADSPNFTGELVDQVVRDSTISIKWAEEKRIEWGENSPLYQSKVLGEFPTDTEAGVIPGTFLLPCRYLDLPNGTPVEAGIDFGASEGGDQTVLRERRGQKVGRVQRWREPNAMKLVGEISLLLKEWGVQQVKVDAGGVGHGVASRLEELSSRHNRQGEMTHDAEVVKVLFAEKASDPRRFLNRRAELWWNGRELARLQQWDVEVLEDDVLAELTAPQYEVVDSSGKIKIEKKADIKKRLGRSPDDADALLLAFFEKTTTVTTSAGQLLRATLPGIAIRR